MTSSARFWCELAWLGGERASPGVLIEVEGDRIATITTDVLETPDGATKLVGLTMPALANTHSHAFHRALRSRTHAARGNFWTWRDQMYSIANRLDPHSYYELASAVFGEMALAGIGVVGEFHYVHHQPDGAPYDNANAMGDAMVAAAASVGLRVTLLDTMYLHGGFATDGADPYAPLADEQRRFSDGTAHGWAERVGARADQPTARFGAAIHSVRAVDPESMEVVRDWAGAYNAPLHVHVSEQVAENEQCRMRHSCTPVELLERRGVLGPATTAVHATHLAGADLGIIAASKAGCCICPTTERDLADGIGPSRAMAEAHISMSLGSDSHAVIDMFEEARAVEMDERLLSQERGVHSAEELLTMATAGGYAALGWPDGGYLGIGNLADFTTIRLDSVRTAGGGGESAVATAVFAASASDVTNLVVGGRSIGGGSGKAEAVGRQLARSIEALTS